MSHLALKPLCKDLQDCVLSYLPPETYATVNRSTNASAKWIQEHSHYRELRAMGRGTFLGRIFSQVPKDRDVVKRVRKIAIEQLNAERLVLWNADLDALGIAGNPKMQDLSYAKMNEVFDRIQERKLTASFELLFRDYPNIAEWFEAEPGQIREWIETAPLNQIEYVLIEAGKKFNAGVVKAIVESEREILVGALNFILLGAVVNHNEELAFILLQSSREFDLSLLLRTFPRERFIDLMIQSDQWRWITPVQAGKILEKSLLHRDGAKESIKILNAIHSVDPRELGRALFQAIAKDVPRVAEAILDSKHLIDDDSLSEVYRKSCLYHRVSSTIAKKVLNRMIFKQRLIQSILTPLHIFGFTAINNDFRNDL